MDKRAFTSTVALGALGAALAFPIAGPVASSVIGVNVGNIFGNINKGNAKLSKYLDKADDTTKSILEQYGGMSLKDAEAQLVKDSITRDLANAYEKTGDKKYLNQPFSPKFNDKKKIKIFDRNIDLTINYDNYPGETTTEQQKRNMKNFIDNSEKYTKKILPILEKYIKNDTMNPNGEYNGNPYSYFLPKEILSMKNKTNNNKKYIVSITGKYKFDPEHGIGINIFKDNIEIGNQDVVLS